MGADEQSAGQSVGDALQEFIRFLRDERRSAALTLDAYERDLLRFVSELGEDGGDVPLADVTSEQVRAHMHRLIGRGLAPATVRRALYALGSFFGWAVRWDLVAKNPIARLSIPRRERVRSVRALSKRERAIVVAAADALAKESSRARDAQAPLLVRLMLKTGLRRSEVLALCWSDLDLDSGELVVRCGKGGKARRVPLEDAELLSRLGALQRQRAIDGRAAASPPVFVNARGTGLSTSTFYKVFHRVIAKAGLSGRGITPHSLRHTFGTVLCSRGVPVPYVKDLLGHEDIGSTMVYVHSTPTALREAVRKLRE